MDSAKLRPALAAIVLTLLAGSGCRPPKTGDSGPDERAGVIVVEVVDGDTVRLDFGPVAETVRLLGIDTPESVHPTLPVQCFGAEASAELRRLLPTGSRVRVFRDRQARDHYDRLLLYLERADDGFDINLHLVEQGFATATFYQPNTARRGSYRAAEHRARSSGRGLWSNCDGPDQPLDIPPPP